MQLIKLMLYLCSNKLVEKLDFEHSKIIKNADKFKGSNSDEYVYILKNTININF